MSETEYKLLRKLTNIMIGLSQTHPPVIDPALGKDLETDLEIIRLERLLS